MKLLINIGLTLPSQHLLFYTVYMCRNLLVNFINAFHWYKQKCMVVSPNFAHPVCIVPVLYFGSFDMSVLRSYCIFFDFTIVNVFCCTHPIDNIYFVLLLLLLLLMMMMMMMTGASRFKPLTYWTVKCCTQPTSQQCNDFCPVRDCENCSARVFCYYRKRLWIWTTVVLGNSCDVECTFTSRLRAY